MSLCERVRANSCPKFCSRARHDWVSESASFGAGVVERPCALGDRLSYDFCVVTSVATSVADVSYVRVSDPVSCASNFDGVICWSL